MQISQCKLPALVGLTLGMALTAAPALSAPLSFNLDVAGIQSFAEEGSALNEVRSVQVGGGSRIVGISWAVTLESTSPSWLSELQLALGATGEPTSLYVAPGFDFEETGTQSVTSGGVIDLAALDMDFAVGADGFLRVEFFEAFDDLVGADGRWVSGTVSFDIPEPSTYALVALGLLGAAGASRRRT